MLKYNLTTLALHRSSAKAGAGTSNWNIYLRYRTYYNIAELLIGMLFISDQGSDKVTLNDTIINLPLINSPILRRILS